ncbi:unnamed protein product (macronuclear) [Paramecium tetraurelia]|uniref:Uncharacterized protein n=1 Tax=Paramecium tetraurelia TaxID=5888 RepID=A0DLI6_PARTE|nr:uncharacterized protein GSPATT00018220001 [Paramecium tetraurelia]CAK83903.1 unnamed protein product [Paramecium tetraurelia]|eukprot:XP_001451300.1 hypothetical protein (macronuclear) [Paramecium tetraurelia strain d4-2]
MEHCEHCRETINEMFALEKQVESIKNQLEIAETQLKLLRQENELLKSNIKKPNKPKHYNQSMQNESQKCYQEIAKLQEIIRHKDEIIQNQIRNDDSVSDKTETRPKQIDTCRKKVKF